jgi:hypothetical protein
MKDAAAAIWKETHNSAANGVGSNWSDNSNPASNACRMAVNFNTDYAMVSLLCRVEEAIVEAISRAIPLMEEEQDALG